MQKVAVGAYNVANAVLQLALSRRRARELGELQAQAEAVNASLEEAMARRSGRMRQNFEHSRMPVVLQVSRTPGTPPMGGPNELTGDMVPMGFDEGMIRMASLGAKLAQLAPGPGVAKILSARAPKLPGAVTPSAGFKITKPAPRSLPGTGTSYSAKNTMNIGAQTKLKPPTPQPGGAPATPQSMAAPAVKPNPSLVPAQQAAAPTPAPTAPRRLVPARQTAPEKRLVPANQQQQAAPRTVDVPAPSSQGPAAMVKAAPQSPPPAQPATLQPQQAQAPRQLQAAPPAQPTTVMSGSAEAIAGMTPEQQKLRAQHASENSIETKINNGVEWAKTHMNRAQNDLGGGKWKWKLPLLAGAGLATAGAYSGAKKLLNWAGTESHTHTGNEGGAVPAYGVNQLGYADRSTSYSP